MYWQSLLVICILKSKEDGCDYFQVSYLFSGAGIVGNLFSITTCSI